MPGTILRTDYGVSTDSYESEIEFTPSPLAIGQTDIDVDKSITGKTYHTVITGADLDSVSIAPLKAQARAILFCFV